MLALDVLQRAEAVVRFKVVGTTGTPWYSDDDENCWRLHGRFTDWPGEVGTGPSMQILKAPKHGTPYAEYWPSAPDGEWIVFASPAWAAPLADLLGRAARAYKEGVRTYVLADGTREARHDGTGDRAGCEQPLALGTYEGVCSCFTADLAMALVVLGLPPDFKITYVEGEEHGST